MQLDFVGFCSTAEYSARHSSISFCNSSQSRLPISSTCLQPSSVNAFRLASDGKIPTHGRYHTWERPDRVEIGAFGRSQPKVAHAKGSVMPFYSQYTPSEEKFFLMARPKMPVSAAQFQRRRPWANRGTLIVAASSPGITNRHSKRGWFAKVNANSSPHA